MFCKIHALKCFVPFIVIYVLILLMWGAFGRPLRTSIYCFITTFYASKDRSMLIPFCSKKGNWVRLAKSFTGQQ